MQCGNSGEIIRMVAGPKSYKHVQSIAVVALTIYLLAINQAPGIDFLVTYGPGVVWDLSDHVWNGGGFESDKRIESSYQSVFPHLYLF
jgi:hypothetical protein